MGHALMTRFGPFQGNDSLGQVRTEAGLPTRAIRVGNRRAGVRRRTQPYLECFFQFGLGRRSKAQSDSGSLVGVGGRAEGAGHTDRRRR